MTIAITRLDLPAARRTGDAKAARRMITIALVHPIVTEAINQARQRVGGVGLCHHCGGNCARHPMRIGQGCQVAPGKCTVNSGGAIRTSASSTQQSINFGVPAE